MRAVIQRVSDASVRYDNVTEAIGRGLVVLLGIGKGDPESQAEWLAKKVAQLRIFENDAGKMDRSVSDIAGEVLVVSQFTLYGDCRKGNRPDFTAAEEPQRAEQMYEKFVTELRKLMPEGAVKTGKFRASMLVSIHNDGPVTIILEG